MYSRFDLEYNMNMGRRTPFMTGEYYHVFNRGVEKRPIFMDKEDYLRFLYILNNFNTPESAFNTKKYSKKPRLYTRGRTSSKLVEIENWCFMPNHYHLCLRQLSDAGISKFLQKVMTGYTMYFNKKYKRSGVLFQGKTKSRYIDREKYLNYLHYYIDLNPLELLYSGWKTKGVPDIRKAREYLAEYFWNKREDYTKERFNADKFNKAVTILEVRPRVR